MTRCGKLVLSRTTKGRRIVERIPDCPECRDHPLLEELKKDPTTGKFWFFVRCQACARTTIGHSMQEAINTWMEMCRKG